ncbi:hypothetical protein ABW19_dt0201507 [Dactylella cylindrospora]|nr:hypothetical protein ABW19_dt0201507 [Dactylella cylindrospora]
MSTPPSPSPKPTLATLPYDILHQIIKLISTEDRTRVSNLEHPFAPEEISPHPLVPFSQTCKSLRSISLPFLFRVVNVSNRRGCQRKYHRMVEQLEDILKCEDVLENVKVLRFYYLGNPVDLTKVVAAYDKMMVEDADTVFKLMVELFRKVAPGLIKLRMIVEPPGTSEKVRELLTDAGLVFPKLQELNVGDCADWMIKLCPNVEVVMQVHNNGNLPHGFVNGRDWKKGTEELVENVKSAKGLRMLWIWGSEFDASGKGLDDIIAAAPKLNHIGFNGRFKVPYIDLLEHFAPLAPTLEHLTFLLIDTGNLKRDQFAIQFAKLLPKLKFVWFSSSYRAEIQRSYDKVGEDGEPREKISAVFRYSKDNQIEWRCGQFDELRIRRH